MSSSVFLDILGQEMTTLAVLDLDDPEIRVDATGPLDIGVELRLGPGAHGAHPDRLAVGASGLGEHPNPALPEVQDLYEHGTGPCVALADHDRMASAELNATDEGRDPDVGGEFQASRRWSRMGGSPGPPGPGRKVSMPHPRVPINPAAVALALALVPGAATPAALDLYYERALMAEAGARCGLFTPQVQSALASAREQARGAALRSGVAMREIQATGDRARSRARAAACDSRDIALAAQRVRKGFEGYARQLRQDFPGDMNGWKADRSVSTQRLLWRLSQDVRQGPSQMRFGVAGRTGGDNLMAVASFPEGAAPYTARIVMRDRRLTSGAYLDARGESLRSLPLPRRMPRSGPFESYSAEARSPAGSDLLPSGVKSAWAFRFPATAAAAMADLDPREAIQVEFLFSSGPPRRLYVEVGDFAAARAFLSVRSG